MTVEEQAPEAVQVAAREGSTQDELPFVDVHTLPGGAHAAVEAVLMVADAPIGADRIAAALDLTQDETDDILHELADEYARPPRVPPPRVRAAPDGGRVADLLVRGARGPVGRFVLDGQSSKLSQAALETLAVVAYRQPVTRGQVSAVRGVNVDGVVRTLLTRGLIAEIGQDPSSGAVLFGTTGYFLERMDFSSLDELPPLAPHLPDLDMIDGLDGLDN